MNSEQARRIEFYSRCIKSLAEKLPRDYQQPKYHNFHIIYKPLRGVYFEWGFLYSKFYVGLMFEKTSSQVNREFISKFESDNLEAALEEQVTFDKNWRKDGKWSRLYVEWPAQEITVKLEKWAVEKAKILIQECEPVLNGEVSRPSQKPVLSTESLYGELPEEFSEGSACKATVNRYERDPRARQQCIKASGNLLSCDVCQMNFLERYGKIGAGFIHVHHRMPLAVRKAEYVLNPKKDLVPVCPNCHAMLHYGRPWDSPLSTDELREIMQKQDGD